MSAGRDRTTVVMAVRPQHADALMAGTKIWEFRRNPLPDLVRTILLYQSGPAETRGVVGVLDVLGQDTASCMAWGTGPCARGYGHTRADPRFGISINDLADYAGPEGLLAARVTGISIRVCTVFPAPIPLSAYGVTTSPQSWVYAPDGWRDVS